MGNEYPAAPRDREREGGCTLHPHTHPRVMSVLALAIDVLLYLRALWSFKHLSRFVSDNS